MNLKSKTSRRKLLSRSAPYWQVIAKGRALGYRVRDGSQIGTWMARRFDARAKQPMRHCVLGIADDVVEADGRTILSHDDAMKCAQEWFDRDREVLDQPTHGGKFKVNDALDEYFKEHRSGGRKAGNIYRQECAANAHIRPVLGEIAVEQLTIVGLKKWMAERAAVPARKRSRKGTETAYRDAPVSEDKRRARRDTVNRILSVLKAALNLAVSNRRVSAAGAAMWREVKPFRGTSKARTLFLSDSEQRNFIKSCEGDFAQLVRAGFYCGARSGELTQVGVRDFDKREGTLFIASRIAKNGNPRHIYLDSEAVRFFSIVAANRPGDEPLFLRDRREFHSAATEARSHPRQWGQSEHARPMREACLRAGYTKPFPFYTLRHSCAARWIGAGKPMAYVANQLGNSVAICEKYYGHLVKGDMAKAMRAVPLLKLPSPKKRPSQSGPQGATLTIPVRRAARSKQPSFVN